MDYELRASFGSANTQSGGVSSGDVAVATAMSGLSLSAVMQSASSWIDLGLQFEQFTGPKGVSDREVVFRTLGLVLSKEVRYRSFFFAPQAVVSFLNSAHYSSGGAELWRAQSNLGASLGASLGWRVEGLGVFLGLLYRTASLGRVFNGVTGAGVAPEALGSRPDFSGLTTSLGVSVLF